MPDIREVDAMHLFLHHATGGKQFAEEEEKHDIMTCVNRCYFSKGTGEGHHYHPLALKALGLQLGCHGENPSLWVKHLPRVRAFNFFLEENPVFDIIRRSFDLLPPRDQALFMDLGCFFFHDFDYPLVLVDWLCCAIQQDEEELICRLEHLKRKGLLQDVDLRFGRISMHDLYWEFAQLEAKGSFNKSTNLRDRMCVYLENGDLSELECRPEGGFWHKLIRLTIVQGSLVPKKHGGIVGQVGGMEGMKWDYFSNVEVLQLFGLHWGHGALNLEGLMRLRILELHAVSGIDRVEGLEKLNHLTYFNWGAFFSGRFSNCGGAHLVGQLPSSLKLLEISAEDVVLGSDLLARCLNLSRLVLASVDARSLDLSKCSSLKSVYLRGLRKLQTLSGLGATRPSSLQSLVVVYCEVVVDIPGIDHLIALKNLKIDFCLKCEVPSLLALTKLQELTISDVQRLVVPAKDFFPRQLRELRWRLTLSIEGPNFNGFNQLKVLDLSFSDGLTSLAELGDLPALRRLDLEYCEHLLQLPDLSTSRNLKELQLLGCSALELREKDIQMLSELPLLQPVPFSASVKGKYFSFDFARGKVLVRPRLLIALMQWKGEDEREALEERDLGAPPIKIGRRGTWE